MNIRIPIIMFVCLMFFSACEKELMTEEEKKSNTEETTGEDADSKLTIVTRAPSGEVISYPVTVYIMNSAGSCVSKEVLETSNDELLVNLAAGTYQVYAVGGATEEDYNLPAANKAFATSEITLRNGSVHADLMTGSNTVKLGRNESNTLVMAMSRKVQKVTAVTIQDLPTAVTAVSVTLAPLYKSLLLNGNYTTDTEEQEETIELTRQSDGTTWKNTATVNLLPAVSAATVKVTMTLNNTNTSFTYSSSQTLEANHELTITGSYTGNAGEFTMSGMFTGAVWGDPTTINFTFNESGAEDAGSSQGGGGNNNNDGEAPAVNTWYKNCFVFMSEEAGDDVVVTLIHRNEVAISANDKAEADVLTEINAALSGFTIDGISGWRLPTAEEANAVPYGAMMSTDVTNHGGDLMSTSEYYYHVDNDQLKCFSRGGINNVVNIEYNRGTRLRPVTTLSFKKQ